MEIEEIREKLGKHLLKYRTNGYENNEAFYLTTIDYLTAISKVIDELDERMSKLEWDVKVLKRNS